MRLLFRTMFLIVGLALSGQAWAQVQGPMPSVNIGGVPMYCISGSGQPVAIYIDPSVNQYIGLATNHMGSPIIALGPGFFSSVPPTVGQFWFLHECAHHVVGGNENAADCFAIKNMRHLGLIWDPNQIHQLLQQVSTVPGSSSHLPGPQRAQNIFHCFQTP